jgi:hypothetical protein
LTANIISRGRGQSAVAAAAYRAGAALRDERYGVTHNYARRRGVLYSQILAPSGAPAWALDRQELWNRVEASELRKDSQLARLIEIGLPVELSVDERVALVRDYAAREFVSQGMIADCSVRGDERNPNPHSHILLTLRKVTEAGFGPKERRWNGKSVLLAWRSAWAQCANDHLARAGHAVRIDHRTLESQLIELKPSRRIGIGRTRQHDESLPAHLIDRVLEQRRIAHDNGEIIHEDPTVALRALTHARPVFTRSELEQFVRSRSGDAAQFERVMLAVLGSPELVSLDPEADLPDRFTSRDMVEAETSLIRRAAAMAVRRGHDLGAEPLAAAAARFPMDRAERHVFDYVTSEGDAKAVAVPASSEAVILAASRHAWSAAGLAVVGSDWPSHKTALSRGTVLLLVGAHTLRMKEIEAALAAADHARAKAVLIADLDRLQAMKTVAAFQLLWRQVGESSCADARCADSPS